MCLRMDCPRGPIRTRGDADPNPDLLISGDELETAWPKVEGASFAALTSVGLCCANSVNRHTILTPYRRPKMTPLERSGSWPDAV